MKDVKFKFKRSSFPVGREKVSIPTKISGDIRYEFDVLSYKSFDRNKTYYSVFFKSIILFTDYNAKSYQILHRYDANTDTRSYYICLYKDKIDNAIPIVRDYTSGYKIYVYDLFDNIKQDENIDIKLVQERTEPDCIIYKIK